MPTGRVLICPCSIFLSIPPPPLDHLSLGTKHTYNTHTAFFSSAFSSFHVSAISHSRQAENTRLSLLCRTRKLLVVIQQPNNHCSVWLLTCVWAEHTHICSQTPIRTHKLSLSLLLYSSHRPIQSAVFFLLTLM